MRAPRGGTQGEGTRGRAPREGHPGGHPGARNRNPGASIAASLLRGEARSLHF